MDPSVTGGPVAAPEERKTNRNGLDLDTSDPKRLDFKVLSFDGGGTKVAYLFQLFEHLTAHVEDLPAKIDLLIGTSSGAIFAAAIACGVYNCPVLQNAKENPGDFFSLFFADRNEQTFVSAPLYGGRRKREMLFEIFENRTLGETHIPLAIVCTELNCEMAVFSSWATPDVLVYEALDASSAAPICFPPVIINGYPYIDGCVSLNNPVLVSYLEAVRYVKRTVRSKSGWIEGLSSDSSSVAGPSGKSEPKTNGSRFTANDMAVLDRKPFVIKVPLKNFSGRPKNFQDVLQALETGTPDRELTSVHINIRIMSFGHCLKRQHRLAFKCPDFVHEIGLTHLILLGVLDNMIYTNSRVDIEMVQHVLGPKNVIRIDSGISANISEASPEKIQEMKTAASATFQTRGQEILAFFFGMKIHCRIPEETSNKKKNPKN
mmetsp:Transcript_3262/g.4719  ORF Transcript_3262/g.4719 Transcript_3262/m.4719 type:complete len:432 (-) Transcript_3262:258-1553(-)